jgi:hypothetical protein
MSARGLEILDCWPIAESRPSIAGVRKQTPQQRKLLRRGSCAAGLQLAASRFAKSIVKKSAPPKRGARPAIDLGSVGLD